ncbi:MAG TPA: hypothetical protein VJ995_05100 [Geothermobacteraceae bacterium]|nr:hypothetical protein [Geothermobacteraceae bacterium]
MGLLLRLSLVVFALCASAIATSAATLTVSDHLALVYRQPQGWQATSSAPEFLVRQTTEHVARHLREAGKPVPEELEQQVRKRLANNELFLYNPQTRAHLEIDFSVINAEDDPPPKESIAKSARYAKDELSQEPDLTDVVSDDHEYALKGAAVAYRVDATYQRDGEPRRFVGVISFVDRYWVFIYYTDEARSEEDLQRLAEVLSGLSLVTR